MPGPATAEAIPKRKRSLKDRIEGVVATILEILFY
jgi:hypothetical protein